MIQRMKMSQQEDTSPERTPGTVAAQRVRLQYALPLLATAESDPVPEGGLRQAGGVPRRGVASRVAQTGASGPGETRMGHDEAHLELGQRRLHGDQMDGLGIAPTPEDRRTETEEDLTANVLGILLGDGPRIEDLLRDADETGATARGAVMETLEPETEGDTGLRLTTPPPGQGDAGCSISPRAAGSMTSAVETSLFEMTKDGGPDSCLALLPSPDFSSVLNARDDTPGAAIWQQSPTALTLSSLSGRRETRGPPD